MRASLTNTELPVLIKVSTGEISLMEGARILGSPDAGFLMQQLRDAGLSLPKLSAVDAEKQAREAKKTPFY